MKKGSGCFIVFLLFVLLVSVLVNVLQFAEKVGELPYVQHKPRFSEVLEASGTEKTQDKIVRIDLTGIISSSSASGVFSSEGMDVASVKQALEQAIADNHVKAVVLRVNTPGGEVTASDTLYHAVKQAAASKPVVVYMDSMAASGGYYLSCGASRIVANETTLTGSIGVIIQALNYSQTLDKVGLESLTFVSGSFKDTLNGARPMRDEEKAYIQGLVSSMYEKFLTIVAEGRKLDKETLRNGVADGRVLTGKDAHSKGLVDQLGYIEDAYAAARELSKSPHAMVVKYQRHVTLGALLGAMGKAQEHTGTLKVDISERLLPNLQPGQAYLLPAHMAP